MNQLTEGLTKRRTDGQMNLRTEGLRQTERRSKQSKMAEKIDWSTRAIADCPIVLVSCLLSVGDCRLVIISCLLSVVYYLLVIVYCLLVIVFCLLSLVYCLWVIVFCLLAVVCGRLSIVCCLLAVVYCLLSIICWRFSSLDFDGFLHFLIFFLLQVLVLFSIFF